MIFVSEAKFLRGSSIYKNEAPVSTITLSSYWIDIYPVTNRRYEEFIDANGYGRSEYWTGTGWEFVQTLREKLPLYWNDSLWNQPDQPVTGVSWWEAMAFAKFEGKTLPTEAQWEYAAGMGVDLYPWGETLPNPDLANFAPGCEPANMRGLRPPQPWHEYFFSFF